MRILRHDGSWYFCAGPVLHKCLEVGYKWGKKDGFDVYWRFRTQGDHAGLTFFVQIWRLFFEFNVHDHRHWDHDKNTWQEYV